jgi:heptosyltransferase II
VVVDAQTLETLIMERNRVLFIQTAFIGDAILTLPAIQKLKEMNPFYLIDVMCIPECCDIFMSSPYIENVIVLEKKGIHKSILSSLRFVNKLKNNNYSKLYSAHRSFRTSLIVLFLRVKESFGFDNSTLNIVYKNLIKYNSSIHEVQRNLNLIGFCFNEENWRIKPEIVVDDFTKNKILSFLKEKKIDNNLIVIAPGSVWETKKYPKKYFEEIINYLLEKKYKVILIGGKKDIELCSSLVKKYNSDVLDTSGLFSVVESIELIRNARILISNDSAPTHMGMSADVKVLTIYCSTVSSFGFYPYNLKSCFVSFDELDCKPCGIHGHKKCPINTFACGEKLEPKTIILTLEGMLDANKR